jgi:transcriptional regulator with XRE-family HTH domain
MAKRVVDGKALRGVRELAGVSQQALAQAIGISKSALSQVESGGGMRIENIKRAADALGVPITSISEIAAEPEPVAS